MDRTANIGRLTPNDRISKAEDATKAGEVGVAELVQAGFAHDSVIFEVLDQHGKPVSQRGVGLSDRYP